MNERRTHHASDFEEHLGDDVEYWLQTLKSNWDQLIRTNKMARYEERDLMRQVS